MTTTQMKYFITLATCLNYTEAANQLYISQPALSRQVMSLERELNLQLFIRDRRSMRLTPAGTALLADLKEIYSHYLDAIERAQMLQRGMFGELNIGVLDGHRASDLFPAVVHSLQEENPNLSVSFFRGSFQELVNALYDGRADFIVTLEFSVQDKQRFSCKTIANTRDYMVMLRTNPLAKQSSLSLSDVKEQTLIAISEEDSPAAYEGMRKLHQQAGCVRPMKVAPNLETLTLWLQAGLGISILNDFNILAQDNDLVFLDWDNSEGSPTNSTDLILAWRKDSCNPAVQVFLKSMLKNANYT